MRYSRAYSTAPSISPPTRDSSILVFLFFYVKGERGEALLEHTGGISEHRRKEKDEEERQEAQALLIQQLAAEAADRERAALSQLQARYRHDIRASVPPYPLSLSSTRTIGNPR